MRHFIPILLVAFMVGCNTPIYNPPTPTTPTLEMDSMYTTADFRRHGDYYNTGLEVFAVDLLSQGLEYDTAHHICGTGCNLFLSDIFTHCDSLPAGHYEIDSVAKDMTFLRGMYFEGGNITGTYLLQIKDTTIQRIVLFESGSMDVAYTPDGIQMDFKLYTADSVYYHATYQGQTKYRVKSKE